jgi:hypothetical protein
MMSRYLLAAALTIGLAACGGGGGDPGSGVQPLSNTDETPDNNSGAPQTVAVAYEGTTLVVGDARYERSPGIELCSQIAICENGVAMYAPGQVIVFFASTNALSANAVITSLGLTINSVGTDSLVVNVPVLFERQWARALLREPVFTSADVNTVMQIGVAR